MSVPNTEESDHAYTVCSDRNGLSGGGLWRVLQCSWYNPADRLDRHFRPSLSTSSCRVCGAPLRRALAELGLLARRRTTATENSFWTAPGTEVVSGVHMSQGSSGLRVNAPERTLILMGD
jgi:hypothetical protein